MAFLELNLGSNIVDVAVNVIRADHPIALIGILHHDGISLYGWNLTSKPPSSPFLKWYAILSSDGFPKFMLQQLAFNGEHSFSVLANTGDRSIYFILNQISGLIEEKLLFSGEGNQGLVGQVPNANPNTYLLLKGTSIVSHKYLDSHLDCTGVVQTLGLLPNSIPRVEVVSLHNVSPQLHSSILQNDDHLSGSHIIFGLSESGLLFANDRVLARNCTSFLVTPAHLIFTTGQHLLKFVHIVGVEGR